MKTAFIALILSFLLLGAIDSAEAARKGALYEVITSTRTIERGQVIGLDDVKSSSVYRHDPRAVTDINAVLGKSLKRTVGKNTTIKHDYLTNGPMVKRGDNIMIVAQREGLRVTAQGRARQNADIGEMIELDNLASGKVITGRLIDSHTVLINF